MGVWAFRTFDSHAVATFDNHAVAIWARVGSAAADRDLTVLSTMQRNDMPLNGELLVVVAVRQTMMTVSDSDPPIRAWIVTVQWRRESDVILLHLLLQSHEPVLPRQPRRPPPGWH
jgi:hypothetical protein